MKIRTKSTIIFLILSLFPLIIIGAIVYKNGEEAIKKSLGLSFQQIAYETIDKVDRSLYEVYRNVQTWSELKIMQEVITQDIDGKISSFLIGLSKEYRYFVSINALDAQGKVVASSNPELIDNNFAQEDYFKNVIKGKKYLGDIHLDKLTKAWVVTFSFPIKAEFEKDKIIGVLCANWHADELQAITQIRKEGNTEENYGHIMLVRGDGLLISAPEFEKNSIFMRNLIKMDLRSVLFAIQKKEGYLVETDEHNRKSLIGYTYSRGYRDFSGFGWIALVVQEAKITFAPIDRFKITVFSIGILVAFIVIIISLILTRRMTSPILKISQASTMVVHGNFESKIAYMADDEIGSLAKNFNKMVLDLKEQRAQLVDKDYVDSIIANMLDALIVIDNKGVIRIINQATADLLGYTKEELIGKDACFLFPEEKISLMGIKLEEMFKIGELKNYEINFKSKDNREIPVIFSSGFLKKIECSTASDCQVLKEKGKHDESILGAVCVAKDITERKQMEKIQRLAQLGELVADMAHEVNNPLMIISGNAQLSLMEEIQSEAVKNNLKIIVEESQRAKGIIQRLLKFSRPTKGKTKELDINKSIEAVLGIVEHQFKLVNVEIKRNYLESPPLISVDEQQMQEVFMNLINNAAEAMPDGGVITISTSLEGDFLRLDFQDTGSGMSEETKKKVFEPFFTTKEKGTGLGLSVCYGIIKAHNGEIKFESELNKGTTVTMLLPLGGVKHNA